MLLPNPFAFAEVVMPSASKAAAPMPFAPAEGAAADPFDGPDIPLADLAIRGFSVAAFLNAMVPPLHADELIPVLQVLAGHGEAVGMIRSCPHCRTEYHANGRTCPECGRANLRRFSREHLRVASIVSREMPDDAEMLAAAVLDLADEYARTG